MSELDIEKIKSILDTTMNDGLSSFMVYNVSIMSGEAYMTEDKQIEMVSYIIKYTINNISDDMNDLLKLVYKFKDIDDMVILINEKVKLIVIDFSLKQNQLLDDEISKEKENTSNRIIG